MDMFQKKPSFLAQRIDEKNRMKESVTGGHRTGLGDKLMRMFAPREPLRYVPVPASKPKAVPLSGLAGYTQHFDDAPSVPATDAAGDATATPAPEDRLFRSPELALQARIVQETKAERDIRKAAEAKAAAREAAREGRAQWDPASDANVQGDPLRTLFVGRLAYETTERRLRRELEEFGPIRSIRIVHDKNSGKPRGYAFVEFEHKNDMKEAYKMADGRKLDGRRIIVDVERGRVVPGWLPRRLGGVKGGESRADRLPKDPMRLFVRRMIEKHVEDREKARRAAEEPATGEEPRDRPSAEASEDRGRDRSRERASRGAESIDRPHSPEPAAGRERFRDRSRSPSSRRDRRSREDDHDHDRRRRGRDEDDDYSRRRARHAEEDDRNGRNGGGHGYAAGSDGESGSDREAGELPQQRDYRSRSSHYDEHDDSEARDRPSDRKRERDGSYDKGSKRMREREQLYA